MGALLAARRSAIAFHLALAAVLQRVMGKTWSASLEECATVMRFGKTRGLSCKWLEVGREAVRLASHARRMRVLPRLLGLSMHNLSSNPQERMMSGVRKHVVEGQRNGQGSNHPRIQVV